MCEHGRYLHTYFLFYPSTHHLLTECSHLLSFNSLLIVCPISFSLVPCVYDLFLWCVVACLHLPNTYLLECLYLFNELLSNGMRQTYCAYDSAALLHLCLTSTSSLLATHHSYCTLFVLQPYAVGTTCTEVVTIYDDSWQVLLSKWLTSEIQRQQKAVIHPGSAGGFLP